MFKYSNNTSILKFNMSHKLLLEIFGAVILSVLSLLFLTNHSIAQPSTLDQIPRGAVTVGNFNIVYDFSDFANCIPDCISITILYDSSNNELTYINHRQNKDVINKTYLNDEQEKVLAEAVPHMRYYNFTDNSCKLNQPYCIASKLKVTSDLNIGSGNLTTTSEWSTLSSVMISNADKIADLLYNSTVQFFSIANNEISTENMTSDSKSIRKGSQVDPD